MNSFVLAIRNEINILNIAYTIVQIRKGLNAIFSRWSIKVLLLSMLSIKSFKNEYESVFSFVQSWVPGLISNYSRVTKSIMSFKYHIGHAKFLAKRPQLEAVVYTHINPFPKAAALQEKRKMPSIPRLPAISLSILDSDIWLNECQCLGIPSYNYAILKAFWKDHISYISNQRSVNSHI